MFAWLGRYFKGDVKSGSKVHVTIGHATVLATATFFGHAEMYGYGRKRPLGPSPAEVVAETAEAAAAASERTFKSSKSSKDGKDGPKPQATTSLAMANAAAAKAAAKEANAEGKGAGEFSRDLPDVAFDWRGDYLWQEGMCRGKGPQTPLDLKEADGVSGAAFKEGGADGEGSGADGSAALLPGLQWCLLQFETPVYTPLKGLCIASRLDTDVNTTSCRIAFYGRLTEAVAPQDLQRLRLFKLKSRFGTVAKLGGPPAATTLVASNNPPGGKAGGSSARFGDVLGQDLFKKETDMKQFIGRRVVTDSGAVGVIDSTFGQSGKFKVTFSAVGGVGARVGERLFLQFKKYVYDASRAMVQDDETNLLQAASLEAAPESVIVEEKKKRKPNKPKAEAKADARADAMGATSGDKVADATPAEAPPAATAPPGQASLGQAVLGQAPVVAVRPLPAAAAAVPHPTTAAAGEVAAVTTGGSGSAAGGTTGGGGGSGGGVVAVRHGAVSKVKEAEGAGRVVVIVDGFFDPSEDARLFEGRTVRRGGAGAPVGVLLGPFGKGGKCKVALEPEAAPSVGVGAKLDLP